MADLFSCPFADPTQHPFSECLDLTSYITHLQKCQIISIKIYSGYQNKFYICPNCLQVYLTANDTQIHREECQKKYSIIIKDESKWVIKLGPEGVNQIKELQDYTSTHINNKTQAVVKVANEPVYQKVLPYNKGHGFLKPSQENMLNVMGDQIPKKPDPNVEKNQLRFQLSDNSFIKTIRVQYFFGHSKQSIKDSLKFTGQSNFLGVDSALKKHNINVTPELLRKSKVLEFVEDVGLEIEVDSLIFWCVQQKGNGSVSIWLLASDQSEELNKYVENLNWAIFKIDGDSDDVVDLTNETMLIKIQPKTEGKSLTQIKASKLDAAKAELEKIKQDYAQLLQKDRELDYKLALQSGATQTIQSKVAEQRRLNQKLATQLMMSEMRNKDIVKACQDKYDSAINQIKHALNQHLEGLKKDLLKEIDEKKIEAHQTIDASQPLLDELKKQVVVSEREAEELRETFNKLQQQMQRRTQGKKNVQTTIKLVHADQSICVECKQRPRNVLIKECQHFVLCEACFQKLASNSQPCPLKSMNLCTRGTAMKKFHPVKLTSTLLVPKTE